MVYNCIRLTDWLTDWRTDWLTNYFIISPVCTRYIILDEIPSSSISPHLMVLSYQIKITKLKAEILMTTKLFIVNSLPGEVIGCKSSPLWNPEAGCSGWATISPGGSGSHRAWLKSKVHNTGNFTVPATHRCSAETNRNLGFGSNLVFYKVRVYISKSAKNFA